jgi:hypothetical protein
MLLKYLKKDLFVIILVFILLFFIFIIGFNLFYGNEKIEGFDGSEKKIAFCFLIYDSINHEELWKRFFDQSTNSKYNIYIHYKENLPLTYFEDKKLDHCIETAWGHKSLVQASNLLFKKAFEDSANYKFVLLSNSCIPLKSFDHVYDFLTKDNMGYVNESVYNDNYKKFELYKKNPDVFAKSSQWVILNRKMVEKTAFVSDEFINENLNTTDVAPDEIYYYTMIKKNAIENQLTITPNLSSGATTFTYWSDMPEYPFPKNPANPYAYDNISTEEIDYLLAQPCLFGRKFNKNCLVDESIDLNEYVSSKLS